jgi:hypothetical protein
LLRTLQKPTTEFENMKKLHAILFASVLGCSTAYAANPPLPALLGGLNLSGLLGSNPVPTGLPLLSGVPGTLGNLSGVLGGLKGLAPLTGLVGQLTGPSGLNLPGLLGLNQPPGAAASGVLALLSTKNGTGALIASTTTALLSVSEINGGGLLTGILRTGNGGLLGFALPVVNGVVQ